LKKWRVLVVKIHGFKRATRNAKAAPRTTLATRQGSQRFTRGMHAMQRFVIFPQMDLHDWLVVWNMNFMTFHSVGNVIIPTDEVIFFRGVGIPPTRICRT
jgi:hypothetical protein